MEPKGGDKPSNRKSSRGVSRCRKQSSRQYERALPLAIPEIRPWGGVSKYKESAYGDVSGLPVHRKLGLSPRSHDADRLVTIAVLQGAQLTAFLAKFACPAVSSAALSFDGLSRGLAVTGLRRFRKAFGS